MDRWDNFHVRLPCSPRNVIKRRRAVSVVAAEQAGDDTEPDEQMLVVIDEEEGNSTTNTNDEEEEKIEVLVEEVVMDSQSKWEVIQESLIRLAEGRARSSLDLQQEILALHPAYRRQWRFDRLHQFFADWASADETAAFFDTVLPTIARLALSLPDLVAEPVALLPAQREGRVTLSQLQIASLLACAFLSLFPQRNSRRTRDYPSINFSPDLFASAEPAHAKFRFLFNYFARWARRLDDAADRGGLVTFARRVATQQPRWAQSRARLSAVQVVSGGAIEEAGSGCLQVDFANKLLGGGVLRRGSAQEEIRFLICPELIVSRLLVEQLNWNESVLVTGCERYASYAGYSDSLQFAADYVDPTPRDDSGHLRTYVLAIDAVDYSARTGSDPLRQYSPQAVARELLKCYCGFSAPHPDDDQQQRCPVATGNWGCGAFAGDVELKAVIQWLAASVVHRPLLYHPFDQHDLAARLTALSDLAARHALTVGQLYGHLQACLDSPDFRPPSSSVFDVLTAAILADTPPPE